MRIIPAIDILDGKCVRLSKGDYSKSKIYNNNPLDVAKLFEDSGIQYLHVVDLDGAKSNQIINHKILDQICKKTTLKVDFGGGLKSDDDVDIAFNNGAHQVTIGSVAVTYPELFKKWLWKYGKDKVILGADCNDRKIAISGWLEKSDFDVVNFITDYERIGVEYVTCTDIAKDGMLGGTSVDLYNEILGKTKIKLVASGGISNIDDLLALKNIGCYGAIIGKALYEGNIKLSELIRLC